jgi:TatD DNase family protein
MDKVKLIDTHAHIYDDKIFEDLENVISRSKEIGIEKILMPNVDSTTVSRMLEIEEKYEMCHAMMGLHPCHVGDSWLNEVKILEEYWTSRNFIGVGEIGIDLYWDKTHYKEQTDCFQRQIDFAKDVDRPIVIHSRESIDICIKEVSERQNGNLKGVFHCFTGDINQAEQIKDLGFYIGIGGVVTYKNSDLSKVICSNGLDNVILETDSPYLPPVPHRGKMNEPCYIDFVLKRIAEALNEDSFLIGKKIFSNSEKLFFS